MFSTLMDPGSVYWVSILCLSCSEQGVTHGGQLRPKGGGAWVCGPGWWDAQRPDVTWPLRGPFPLHRRRQEQLLGLGVELRRQEGLGSIEGGRWGYSYLFAPYSSPPSFPSPLLPCESGLATAQDRKLSSSSSLFSSSTFFIFVCFMQVPWNL